MIYGLTLKKPKLLIFPRVIHEDRPTNIRIYDYEYDDGLDLNTHLRTSTNIDQRPKDKERQWTIGDEDDYQWTEREDW